MDPKLRRTLTYVALAVIMLWAPAPAVLSLRSGHAARGASTFVAGLSFSILFWTTTRRRTEK